MARLLIVSRSMALAIRLADQHQVIEHPADELDTLESNLDADVLILDLGDPVLAVNTVNSLREAEQVIPVLLVSGYQAEWEQVEAQQVDGVHVVPLPITRLALLTGISALTGEEPAETGPSEPSADQVPTTAPTPVLNAAMVKTEPEPTRATPDNSPETSTQSVKPAAPPPKSTPAPAQAAKPADALPDPSLPPGSSRPTAPPQTAPPASEPARTTPTQTAPPQDAPPQTATVQNAPPQPGAEPAIALAPPVPFSAPESLKLPVSPEPPVTPEPNVSSESPKSPVPPGSSASPASAQGPTTASGAPGQGPRTPPVAAGQGPKTPPSPAGQGPRTPTDDVPSMTRSDVSGLSYSPSLTRPFDQEPRTGQFTLGRPAVPPVPPLADPPRWTPLARPTETPGEPDEPVPPNSFGNAMARRVQRLGNRPRKLQRRPDATYPQSPAGGLVTDPLGPRTDPFGFPGSDLDRRLDAEAAALVTRSATAENGFGVATSELVRLLRERAGELYSVDDTAQALADDVIERADADAAAVLIPDGSIWRVSAGVGLRPLERRLELADSHWLIIEIGSAGRAVLIEDTDIIRQQLSGAPLAAWRHLMAVPVPDIRGIVVLARGEEGGPFSDHDLSAVIAPVREAAALLAQAVETRRLARLLGPLA